MEPNKFEEQIREKLQERELQPSKAAWSKLDQQLAGTRKRGLGRFAKYAVAAAVAGLLVVVASRVWKADVLEQPQQIVEQTDNMPADNQDNNEVLIEGQLPSDEVVVEENPVLIEEETKTQQKRETPPQVIAQQNTSQKSDTTNELIKNSTGNNTSEVAFEEPKNVENKDIIDQKVEEVATAIAQLQEKNNEVTMEEIDALLAKAQRDISNQQILDSQTNSVDATALLQDVESELERSFRDKVFEALGEGFEKVRTAVAERNQ